MLIISADKRYRLSLLQYQLNAQWSGLSEIAQQLQAGLPAAEADILIQLIVRMQQEVAYQLEIVRRILY